MHSAPSVSYPVGRSRFHAICLVAISVAGLVAGLLWRQQAEPVAWQQILFALLWFGSSSAAFQSWRGSLRGILQWDGQVWHWGVGASTAVGRLKVQLDLQHCLLLRLRVDSGQVTWLWLERGGDTILWDALRRAAFSDAASGLAPAARADDHGVS